MRALTANKQTQSREQAGYSKPIKTKTNIASMKMGRETNNFSQKQLIITDGLCPKIKQLLRGAKHEAVEIDHESNPLD